MTTPSAPPVTSHVPPPVAIPPEAIYRLSVEQYHEMARHGILDEDAPVELLEGWLVTKMTKYPAHSMVTQLLRSVLDRRLPPGWHVRTQEPITLEDSEPEPDVAVVRGDFRAYPDRQPGPADTGLLVEVADSSLTRARGWKKRLYARAGIAVYWIVNLADARVEVYTDPTGPAAQPDYRQHQDYGPGDDVPFALAGQELRRIACREFMS
jgi:Uma2 family endonuclease